MKTLKINLYLFAELNDDAKERAIQEHMNFLDTTPEPFENEDGKMVSEYVEHSISETIESIEMNEYHFYFDGEMANYTRYVGNHPLAGTAEVVIHGETFRFKE